MARSTGLLSVIEWKQANVVRSLGIILLVSVVSTTSDLCSLSLSPKDDKDAHDAGKSLTVTCTVSESDSVNITYELLQLQLNISQPSRASVVMEIVCNDKNHSRDDGMDDKYKYYHVYLPAFARFPNLVSLTIRNCTVLIPPEAMTAEDHCRSRQRDQYDVDNITGHINVSKGLEVLQLHNCVLNDTVYNSFVLCDLIPTLRELVIRRASFATNDMYNRCIPTDDRLNHLECQDFAGLSNYTAGTPSALEVLDFSDNSWFGECMLCNIQHEGVFNKLKVLNLSQITIYHTDASDVLNPLLNFSMYFPNVETIDLSGIGYAPTDIIHNFKDNRKERRHNVTVLLLKLYYKIDLTVKNLDRLEELSGVFFDINSSYIKECSDDNMENIRSEIRKRAIFRRNQKYHYVSEWQCFACEEDKYENKSSEMRARERLGDLSLTICKTWIKVVIIVAVSTVAVLLLAIILTLRYSHRLVFRASWQALKTLLLLSPSPRLTSSIVVVSFDQSDVSFVLKLKQQLEKRNIQVFLQQENSVSNDHIENDAEDESNVTLEEHDQQVLLVCSVAYVRNKWYTKHSCSGQPYSRVIVILLEESRLLRELVNMQMSDSAMPWNWPNCATVLKDNTFLLWNKLGSILKQPKVFVAYDEQDTEFVNGLARRLESHGYRLCLQHRDISAGVARSDGIQTALSQCCYALMICSPAYIRNEWTVWTHSVALLNEVNKRPGSLVIILCDGATQAIREQEDNEDVKWSFDNNPTIKTNTCLFWTRLYYALRQQGDADAVINV